MNQLLFNFGVHQYSPLGAFEIIGFVKSVGGMTAVLLPMSIFHFWRASF